MCREGHGLPAHRQYEGLILVTSVTLGQMHYFGRQHGGFVLVTSPSCVSLHRQHEGLVLVTFASNRQHGGLVPMTAVIPLKASAGALYLRQHVEGQHEGFVLVT